MGGDRQLPPLRLSLAFEGRGPILPNNRMGAKLSDAHRGRSKGQEERFERSGCIIKRNSSGLAGKRKGIDIRGRTDKQQRRGKGQRREESRRPGAVGGRCEAYIYLNKMRSAFHREKR